MLQEMISEVQGGRSYREPSSLSEEDEIEIEGQIIVSVDLIRSLFTVCDELRVPDDLISKMVEAAGGEGAPLDYDSLLRAISCDLACVDPKWENKLSTSYADIVGGTPIIMGKINSILRLASVSGMQQQSKAKNQLEVMEESIKMRAPVLDEIMQEKASVPDVHIGQYQLGC
jgi:hypothetical protein